MPTVMSSLNMTCLFLLFPAAPAAAPAPVVVVSEDRILRSEKNVLPAGSCRDLDWALFNRGAGGGKVRDRPCGGSSADGLSTFVLAPELDAVPVPVPDVNPAAVGVAVVMRSLLFDGVCFDCCNSLLLSSSPLVVAIEFALVMV